MKQAGAILLFTVMQASSLSAQDAPSLAWQGVWQGTIGDLPVHACLTHRPYTDLGAYYYDRVKSLIRIEREGEGKDWVEGPDNTKPDAPRWRIDQVSASDFSGRWSDKTRSLPIRLKRIGGPGNDDGGPCASLEFQRPRLAPVNLTSKAGVKEGARFTSWTFKPGPPFPEVEVSTFTLDRPGAQVTRVNTLLRAVLPEGDGRGDWLDCMMGSADAHGVDGDYSESIEPTLVTGRWLGAAHQVDTYCGGAHPETDTRLQTFDLQSGVEVDPLDWFKPSAVNVERFKGLDRPSKTLTPAFIAMILKDWKHEEADCDDPVRSYDYWDVGIARGSLVFSPDLPRAFMACGEDFRIPFARLQPWLNAKGKAAVASLPKR